MSRKIFFVQCFLFLFFQYYDCITLWPGKIRSKAKSHSDLQEEQGVGVMDLDCSEGGKVFELHEVATPKRRGSPSNK